MTFVQEPPQLGNQYDEDRVLRSFLRRTLPTEVLSEIEPQLRQMGELTAGRLLELSVAHRCDEPEHIPFNPWGQRIDEVRVNAAWREYQRVAAQEGLIAIAYERAHGAHSRIHQFALVHLFDPSTQFYTCPLAMTDGCARTLETLAAPELRERVLPRLVSRDPARAWTSGQWMTEQIGGSDVGLSETLARNTPEGWRLDGTKWFVSAATSEVALTLARPEGNGPGGKGLALFFVQARDERGRLNRILLNRLKDKLGTRQLPTAELVFQDTPAEPVCGTSDGVRNMSTMLNLTRTWNAVCSVAKLRRGLALARDYARRRVAFGAPLAEKPLHAETLADLAAEQEAAFLLAFHAVTLLGREETGELEPAGAALLQLLHLVAKLVTARQAVAGASEILESFGGAGYVEDTGLPELLRDCQVYPIWEGTTNVLALECFRAVQRADALAPFLEEIRTRASVATHPALLEPAGAACNAGQRAREWWSAGATRGPVTSEAGARRFAFTLGRSLALALLVEQAQWAIDRDADGRSAEAARRFAAAGVDFLDNPEVEPGARNALALEDPHRLKS